MTTAYRLSPLYDWFSSCNEGSVIKALTFSGSVYIPPEDTVITRGLSEHSNKANIKLVNKNGPISWLATVISIPCGLVLRVLVTAPAL